MESVLQGEAAVATSRRRLLAGAGGFALSTMLTRAGLSGAAAQDDPLPSWNDGAAKQAILDFVAAATDEGNDGFVPLADRIATFDQDGTLWVEHPIYGQAVFAIDRIKALAPDHPEWTTTEPYEAILSGDQKAMAGFSEQDWEQIIGATHAGMTVEDFQKIAAEWAATAKDPHFDHLYTQLAYQPMLEVLDLLRDNDFRTYIVSGGGQAFIRSYAEDVYGIPPEQVIGTTFETTYGYADGRHADPDQRAPSCSSTTTTAASRRTSTSSSASDRRSPSATRPATSRCWSGPTPGSAPTWRCSSTTTTPSANTPMARRADCPTRTSAPSPRR